MGLVALVLGELALPLHITSFQLSHTSGTIVFTHCVAETDRRTAMFVPCLHSHISVNCAYFCDSNANSGYLRRLNDATMRRLSKKHPLNPGNDLFKFQFFK
jgi:hypothetical protein